jgi:hypothetical protein
MWIRTDLAPDTDQLATLRFDAGGSFWDFPIYDVAASTGSKVSKAWRVRVGGATGFVPIAESGASHPALKYQHNGTPYEANDALTAAFTLTTTASKDGFEDGDYTSSPDWTDYTANASAATVQTGTVFRGTYSLEFDLSSVTDNIALLKSQGRTINDGEILCGWFKLPSGSDDTYYGITEGTGDEPFAATNYAVVNFNDSGTSGAIVANTSAAGDTSTGVTWDDGNWHGVELEYDLTNSEMTLRAYDPNGNLEGSVTVEIGFDATNSNYIHLSTRENEKVKHMDNLAYF